MNTREAAVSGSFYPSDAKELSHIVIENIDKAESKNITPTIIVSPHAGFIYSGVTAGTAYKQLQNIKDEHYSILLVGPAHTIGFEGFAFPFSNKFATPLGDIIVNQDKIETFMNQFSNILPVFRHDLPHKNEHCLETQLPFLQKSLKSFDIIPIVYGKSDYNDLSSIFEYFLSLKNIIVVVSSDLSHFHDQNNANKIDHYCNDGITELDINKLSNGEACGMIGLKAAVSCALRTNLEPLLLDYRTSGDTAGDKSRVVGYASYVFYKKEGAI